MNRIYRLKLVRLAADRGSNAELLAREAIERLVDNDEGFIREVDKGIASADRGELLSHEEVGTRLKKLIAEKHFGPDGSALDPQRRRRPREHQQLLFEQTPERAADIVQRIYDAPAELLKFPHRGRPGNKRETRELVLSSLPYLVVYRIAADTVQILRILHGAQKWSYETRLPVKAFFWERSSIVATLSTPLESRP